MNPLYRLQRLSERDAEKRELLVSEARRSSASERLAQAVELCDLARELARSVGADWVSSTASDLSEKARRHPLGR